MSKSRANEIEEGYRAAVEEDEAAVSVLNMSNEASKVGKAAV